jgi:hypothetical protein
MARSYLGSVIIGLPLLASIAGCGPQSDQTSPPSRFLLTCTRPDASAMVLRLDTGDRRFTIVNADGAPDGAIVASPYSYSLSTAAWTGRVNRYDGQLQLVRTQSKPSAAATPEAWSCISSADKAKF